MLGNGFQARLCDVQTGKALPEHPSPPDAPCADLRFLAPLVASAAQKRVRRGKVLVRSGDGEKEELVLFFKRRPRTKGNDTATLTVPHSGRGEERANANEEGDMWMQLNFNNRPVKLTALTSSSRLTTWSTSKPSKGDAADQASIGEGRKLFKMWQGKDTRIEPVQCLSNTGRVELDTLRPSVTYCTITIWNVRTNQYIGKRGLNLRYILPSAVFHFDLDRPQDNVLSPVMSTISDVAGSLTNASHQTQTRSKFLSGPIAKVKKFFSDSEAMEDEQLEKEGRPISTIGRPGKLFRNSRDDASNALRRRAASTSNAVIIETSTATTIETTTTPAPSALTSLVPGALLARRRSSASPSTGSEQENSRSSSEASGHHANYKLPGSPSKGAAVPVPVADPRSSLEASTSVRPIQTVLIDDVYVGGEDDVLISPQRRLSKIEEASDERSSSAIDALSITSSRTGGRQDTATATQLARVRPIPSAVSLGLSPELCASPQSISHDTAADRPLSIASRASQTRRIPSAPMTSPPTSLASVGRTFSSSSIPTRGSLRSNSNDSSPSGAQRRGSIQREGKRKAPLVVSPPIPSRPPRPEGNLLKVDAEEPRELLNMPAKRLPRPSVFAASKQSSRAITFLDEDGNSALASRSRSTTRPTTGSTVSSYRSGTDRSGERDSVSTRGGRRSVFRNEDVVERCTSVDSTNTFGIPPSPRSAQGIGYATTPTRAYFALEGRTVYRGASGKARESEYRGTGDASIVSSRPSTASTGEHGLESGSITPLNLSGEADGQTENVSKEGALQARTPTAGSAPLASTDEYIGSGADGLYWPNVSTPHATASHTQYELQSKSSRRAPVSLQVFGPDEECSSSSITPTLAALRSRSGTQIRGRHLQEAAAGRSASKSAMNEELDRTQSVLRRLESLKNLRALHSELDEHRNSLEAQVRQALLDELEVERATWMEKIQRRLSEVEDLQALVDSRVRK